MEVGESIEEQIISKAWKLVRAENSATARYKILGKLRDFCWLVGDNVTFSVPNSTRLKKSAKRLIYPTTDEHGTSKH